MFARQLQELVSSYLFVTHATATHAPGSHHHHQHKDKADAAPLLPADFIKQTMAEGSWWKSGPAPSKGARTGLRYAVVVKRVSGGQHQRGYAAGIYAKLYEDGRFVQYTWSSFPTKHANSESYSLSFGRPLLVCAAVRFSVFSVCVFVCCWLYQVGIM